MKSLITLLTLITLSAAVHAGSSRKIDGLKEPALVFEDADGIPHIFARNEHDMVLLQGWVHARDRLFQMDVLRRSGKGTLAELLGSEALPSDVESRVIGIARAAERAMSLTSDEAMAGLEAYAAGVNAYIATHELPPEYGVLGIETFEPWTPLDSLTVGRVLIFRANFELEDIERSQAFGAYLDLFTKIHPPQNFGDLAFRRAQGLFFADLFRVEPLVPAFTVPDALVESNVVIRRDDDDDDHESRREKARDWKLRPEILDMGRRYLERIKDHPELKRALEKAREGRGSNEWAISPALTENGRTLLASDEHLELIAPSLWYEIHLRAPKAGFNVAGSSLAGVPYVVLGHNQHIAWGATIHFADVTDVYQEEVVLDPSSASGLSTRFGDGFEHVEALLQTFRFNAIAEGMPGTIVTLPSVDGGPVPKSVLIVPRRNHGPIVDFNPATGAAISVQFTGFSGSRELDSFRAWNRARSLDDFVEGLKIFDVGSFNWAVADVNGNIGYFISGGMPIREDLQSFTVNGLPPFLIRNGQGGNEWLPAMGPPPDQVLPFEVLPFEEMPQIVNPPAGFLVNGNNDPLGLTEDNDVLNDLRKPVGPGGPGGLYYLSGRYNFAARAGRIKELLEAKLAEGPLNIKDMTEIQADVVMTDARIFTPFILAAYENGQTAVDHTLHNLATNEDVMEAVERLADWDFSTPTGIPEGYDASDEDGVPDPDVSDEEAADSVAATIYSMWRSQFIKNSLDRALLNLAKQAHPDADPLPIPPGPGSQQTMTALKHLLVNFDITGGKGASGLNFFDAPGDAPPPIERDIIILQSLKEALDRLASKDFEPAFGPSPEQDDFRWGKLHRITFEHVIGGPFNTPPAGGAFPQPLPTLAGIPVDGGFQVVDASDHDVRADGLDEFNFSQGPTRRFVSQLGHWPGTVRALSALPGGESGVIGDPHNVNLLGRWLTNDTYPLRTRIREILRDFGDVEFFTP